MGTGGWWEENRPSGRERARTRLYTPGEARGMSGVRRLFTKVGSGPYLKPIEYPNLTLNTLPGGTGQGRMHIRKKRGKAPRRNNEEGLTRYTGNKTIKTPIKTKTHNMGTQ